MRYLMILSLLASCAAPVPHEQTDIPFCKEDAECGIYRSACGKTVAFNLKYAAYVESEFKKREANMQCRPTPLRRYGTRCEMNSCVLLER